MQSRVLILGRHLGMMQNVISLLQQNGFYNVTGVLTNEDVINKLNTNTFELLVIGGGVDGATRQIIKKLIAEKNFNTKVVEHYGKPATLIEEIKSSLL